MKKAIKHYFPLILTVLCVVFAISILFYGFTSQNGIFTEIGSHYLSNTQKNNSSSVAEEVEALEKAPLPTPKYIGNALITGETYSFDELFSLELSDGSQILVDEVDTAGLYLIDIKYPGGSSVLTELSTEAIASLEEIPSAAIYDTENHLLSFHKSGIYTMYVRLYFDYRPGVLFECQVPVEVG